MREVLYIAGRPVQQSTWNDILNRAVWRREFRVLLTLLSLPAGDGDLPLVGIRVHGSLRFALSLAIVM